MNELLPYFMIVTKGEKIMDIIALYLPQYHVIEENNLWWGNGYTEWTSLKRGEVLIENQYQPRIPLNNNYYDLTNIDIMKWQVEIAKKHCITGFCFYHYWFNGQLLLEKPLEQWLNNTEIDFPYYLCWANETWTTVWEGEAEPKVLAKHDYYDSKDIDNHFYYMLRYFKDVRYMKRDDKPILNIYNPIAIPYRRLKKMLYRWNYLAEKEGLNGIYFMYQSAESMRFMTNKYKKLFDKGIEYEPSYVEFLEKDLKQGYKKYKKEHLSCWMNSYTPTLIKIKKNLINNRPVVISKEITEGIENLRDYDNEWKKILDIKHRDYSKYVPGGFVDWDNTPRRGRKGKVILGATPQKFESYFSELVYKAKNTYNSDMIVLFAWNEWSEGGYLEPDEKYGFGYLEAVKRVMENEKK